MREEGGSYDKAICGDNVAHKVRRYKTSVDARGVYLRCWARLGRNVMGAPLQRISASSQMSFRVSNGGLYELLF